MQFKRIKNINKINKIKNYHTNLFFVMYILVLIWFELKVNNKMISISTTATSRCAYGLTHPKRYITKVAHF